MTDTTQMAFSVKDKITALVSNKTVRGIAATMLMKVASAFVAFALFSLAANAAGAEEFGRFSILFSIVSILSIIAACGQPLHVVRAWSEYLVKGHHGLALGAIRYGWIIVLLGVLIVGSVLGAFLALTSDWTPFDGGDKALLVAAVLAFLVLSTLCIYSSNVARSTVGILLGDANFELTWRSVTILFLSACLFAGAGVDATAIFTVFSFGLLIVLASQTFYITRAVRAQVGQCRARYDRHQWGPRSVRLWLASIMEACNQHMEVFLIGMLLDPIAAGAYFVAARLANAFALAATGINTFGVRRIPALYFVRDIPSLKQTLHVMAGMSFIVVAVGMLTVVFAGDWMLWIFGSTYMDYYHILVILSVGTALNAANGPAPSFLMLTGHEGRYTRIVTGSVILRLAGFFVFVPTFGIVGAAVVTATVMSAMALLLNVYCRSMTGMDPSILRFFYHSSDEPAAGFDQPKLSAERSAL